MTVPRTRDGVCVELTAPDDFDAWRTTARRLLAAAVPPDDVAWHVAGECPAGLFATAARGAPPASEASPARASRAFLQLAAHAALHRDPARFDLLYRLLWRLQRTPRLMEQAADPQVRRAELLARQVRRDIHKMRAFLRFRAVPESDGPHYVAWFEPEHHILRANARFFVDRFASQRWSILTPALSLLWDGASLHEGPGAHLSDAPSADPVEAAWHRYYASIFNPARLKVGAMLKEMPRKYWHMMPETRLIPAMIAGARARETAMHANAPARFDESDRPHSLSGIADAIQTCRKCPIGCNGTRAVAGEGPADAALMIVGEQPGDSEEHEGRPFAGPAGQLLDRHLAAAGIDPGAAWITNAVKHFKFAPRGQHRLHQTPTAGEIDMCRWWLDGERALVRPRLILALGASAARGLLGRTPAIGRERGAPITLPDGASLLLTAHPSYLLRLDGEAQAREEARFGEDLKQAAALLTQSA
ncbi:MAG: UdgX family uracil-DNA binding protein [Sphingomonadales bacterium]|nr:UdgX family uracil-DNA binding protein [Sphingomonadales bacterium]